MKIFTLARLKTETGKGSIILSVAWEQMLNTSAEASIQHAATKVTDRMIEPFPVSSVLMQIKNTDTNVPMFLKLRGKDLNQRPPGYEPDELPDCSTPRY